jgi:hypothetical protein
MSSIISSFCEHNNVPNHLIAMIVRFCPTPHQLIVSDFEKNGIPTIAVDARRGTFRIDIIKYRDINATFDESVQPFYAAMQNNLNDMIRRKLKMRADLMAFHLSKQ